MIKTLSSKRKHPAGNLLLSALVFGTIAVIMIGGLVSLGLYENKAITARQNKEFAFQIAEAGINYYRWHLAHSPADYQDGTGGPGPYVHDYKDKDGIVIGQFSLNITPPILGSTLVIIESTGYLTSAPKQKRTLRVRFAIPSFAKYAVVTDNNIRYGVGTEVYGELHSNGGTQFDGVAHNVVASAKTCYNDPDTWGGGSCERPGVWTSVSPESSVFLVGKSYPVPAVDFAGIAADLADIKTKAQAAGYYFAPSGDLGYHIILNANDTFDIYKVKKMKNKCSNWLTDPTWTITPGQETLVAGSPFTFSANGLIFVEDNVWVNGSLDTARLTIGSAVFPSSPSTDTSIIITNDITYTHNDGQEVLGLIAQKDILTGLESEDDLRIDAAIGAASGYVGRPDYHYPSCNPYDHRAVITLYGMIATYKRYGFARVDGTGYQTRNLNYDTNLLYNPPPEFPLSSDQYQLIDWQEVLP